MTPQNIEMANCISLKNLSLPRVSCISMQLVASEGVFILLCAEKEPDLVRSQLVFVSDRLVKHGTVLAYL